MGLKAGRIRTKSLRRERSFKGGETTWAESESQKKGCLEDHERFLRDSYPFLKDFEEGTCPSSRALCFLSAWGHFLVLTIRSLKISQRTHKPFPHP